MESMKLLLLLSLLSTSAFAQKILVFAGDTLGYPADPLCYFSNSKMVPHPQGFLVKYTCFRKPDVYGELWLLKGEKAELVAQSEEGNVLGDPVVLKGKVYVTEFNEIHTTKFYEYDGKLRELSLPDSGIDVKGFAPMGDKLLYRYTDASGESGEGTWSEDKWEILPRREVSYFFNAGWSAELVLQKIRMRDLSESSPDHVEVRLAPEYRPVIVASDRDHDPSSPFKVFLNYASVNGHRWVMNASTDAGQVALLGSGTSYEVVELYKFFKSIDNWPATVSEDGSIIIRAQHLDGRYGLWSVKKDAKLILQSGDPIENLQAGRVLFYNSPIMKDDKVLIGIGLEKEGEAVGQGILSLPL
jgi:hypothetical protein